jgi:bacterioferritin (cytochrome b1)
MEDMGGNISGIQTAPELAEEQIEGSAEAKPSSKGGPDAANEIRAAYISEGFPVGSLPSLPYGEMADADEDEMGKAVFLDKLSERLAFERMGTRLYDALINKCQTIDDGDESPTLDELREIRDEEHRHFLMLKDAIEGLGGDPTVQSPCADVTAVASMGIMQVLMDPRTSVTQCLNAILTAELTDNAGWEMLIDLADGLGQEELSEQFTEALDNEQQHLINVQTWLSDRVMAKV